MIAIIDINGLRRRPSKRPESRRGAWRGEERTLRAGGAEASKPGAIRWKAYGVMRVMGVPYAVEYATSSTPIHDEDEIHWTWDDETGLYTAVRAHLVA